MEEKKRPSDIYYEDTVGRKWIDQPRTLNVGYYGKRCRGSRRESYRDRLFQPFLEMDNSYEKIEYIPGLKTELYLHQQNTLMAMIDAETRRKLLIRISDRADRREGVYSLGYNSAVLSEPVGTGKTVEILSLILINKHPTKYPDITHINFAEALDRFHHDPCNPLYIHTSIVRRKFKTILKPTIIFVGSSVLEQWKEMIARFTELTLFLVENIIGLKGLFTLIENKKINKYDIVLVKNGKITRRIKSLPYGVVLENKNRVQTAYIYNIIANIRTCCWSRVVIDDFDTIGLPYNAGLVNGIFTWYISSTSKKMQKRNLENTQFKTTSDMLLYSDYGCSAVMNNPLLFSMLNIRNRTSFIRDVSMIGKPRFYVYQFINPNEQYIQYLSGLEFVNSEQIIEMLNSDAIETASEILGIKTTSIADIFQKVSGDHYNNYEKSIRVLRFIDESRYKVENLPSVKKIPDKEAKTYGKRDLLNFRPILYKYPNLAILLEETKEEYEELKNKSENEIECIKSNIEYDTCGICLTNIKNNREDTFTILKCCRIILCSKCCLDMFGRKLICKCAFCRRNISMKKDVIYLGSNFDFERILNESIDDEEKIEEKDEDSNTEVDEDNYTKINAVVDIINGNPIKVEGRQVNINTYNLIKGIGDLPEPGIRKVLIFANYMETIRQIEKEFNDKKIPYLRLMGTPRQINDIVHTFNEVDGNISLIIDSARHCSGLNLQTSTDLVFMHRMVDKNIESQVIGRGQRLGRRYNLNVHFMLYKNEYKQMLYNNEIVSGM
jgi:SNF2 family DNA or RNA helicase